MNRLLNTYVLIRIGLLCLLTGCASMAQIAPGKLTSINIIDRNGLTETISSKERLGAYQKADFLSPQPYQKVMRVYGKEKNGDVHSTITSYHPNGQVKQYLEAVNGRASGVYKEWHPNGQLKIESQVIGGVADINTQAEESWLFEGTSRAWDVDGNLLATISYSKGELEGESLYFHPNGQVWKQVPYSKNAPEGTSEIFLESGSLFQSNTYKGGLLEGTSVRFWEEGVVTYREEYEKGLLKKGEYFDREGNCVATIQNGKGSRALFGKTHLQELQEFCGGVQEGLVQLLDEGGEVIRTYFIKGGEKQGEEIDYYPSQDGIAIRRLLITWNQGVMEGPIKTWYENGNLESQREMCQNQKNGLSTAWYQNGSLMLVEEYDCDRLVHGEYYRLGETIPFSKIEKGEGIATLFNADGNFSRKILYHDGRPVE